MKSIRNSCELAKYVLAERAFLYAKTFLPLLRTHLDSESGAAAYGAICAYYARPFSASNRGFGPIDSSFVPLDLGDTHKELIEHRNKIFAHTDADAQALGVLVNNVVFDVSANDIRVGSHFICPSTQGLDRISRLLDRVHAETSKAVLECLNNCEPSRRKLSPGAYRLNLSPRGPSDSWFIPA